MRKATGPFSGTVSSWMLKPLPSACAHALPMRIRSCPPTVPESSPHAPPFGVPPSGGPEVWSSGSSRLPLLRRLTAGLRTKIAPPAFDISKPGVIFTRLEVYLVNSPSRPNLRPVDPPPLGASVRHHGLLPRSRAGWGRLVPTVAGVGGVAIRLGRLSPRWPSARTIKPQSRQKPQQSCVIKAHQA